METLSKLVQVASETTLEAAEDVSRSSAHQQQACGHTPTEMREQMQGFSRTVEIDGKILPIHMAAAGGRRVPLLKAMLTTACERDCYYCPFRAGRNSRRVNFKPEEMALAFAQVHKTGEVEGLFLSTGILRGGANTQNKLLDTAEILRSKYGYRGYLHLKIMPGAEKGQVLRAMQLADRVSVNLEAPNPGRLASLAPKKDYFEELLEPLRWAHIIRAEHSPHLAWNGRWASTTTQFVVGAAGESDAEILHTSASLLQQLGLRRTYYEAFHPVEDTPLDHLPAENPLRQHRLYQASFLLRDYAFGFEELPFESSGNLPLDADPKQAYADEAFLEAPLEINNAERDRLLRIPGFGPGAVSKILATRGEQPFVDISMLNKLGIAASRASPYITLSGKRPARQLSLL